MKKRIMAIIYSMLVKIYKSYVDAETSMQIGVFIHTNEDGKLCMAVDTVHICEDCGEDESAKVKAELKRATDSFCIDSLDDLIDTMDELVENRIEYFD